MTTKLSIITINRNNAEGLRKTIESVVYQTFTDYEFIIIDGASTDNSVDIIREHADKISYWVSEPDKGIYNAMNKGIRKAQGEYCLFLNSGDWLCDNKVLSSVFSEKIISEIIYGDKINYLFDHKKIITYPDKLTFLFFYTNSLCHQATFIKRNLFEKIAYYNESKKYDSDWEFFMLALVDFKCSYKHVSINICNFDLNGISSVPENSNEMFEERKNTLNKLYPFFYEDYKELVKAKQFKDQYSNRGIKKSAIELLRLIHKRFSAKF